MPDQYDMGADWLAHLLAHHKRPLSPFGRRVADLLGALASGIYHLNEGDLLRTDWSQEYVRFVSTGGWLANLATYDSHLLTALVVLAHDAGIRASLSPTLVYRRTVKRKTEDGDTEEVEEVKTPHPGDRDDLVKTDWWPTSEDLAAAGWEWDAALEIYFHDRPLREGCFSKRQPDLLPAIERVRQCHPLRPEVCRPAAEGGAQ